MPDYTLVLATGNAGKIAEIESMLPSAIKAASAGALGLQMEVRETGQTFLENATIKALAIARQLNLPSLADDSGLCVEALNGAPGVRSARFAGEHANDEQNNQALLKIMWGKENRAAYFACCMVCARPDGSLLTAEGRLYGEITTEPRGINGFGYDPLFLLPGRGLTVAELDPKSKNTISHRGQALSRLMRDLPAFLRTQP